MNKSDFGKGFTYCIGLFLCHSERDHYTEWGAVRDYISTLTFFYGAADHLLELEIPDLPFKGEVEEWKDKCITWKVTPSTKEDRIWATNKAKEFLLKYDQHCGISAVKGDYE